MKTCEYVLTWNMATREPGRFCGTVARWRYPTADGGHCYLCDEHGLAHINIAEPAPPGGWDNPQIVHHLDGDPRNNNPDNLRID